MRKIKLPNRTPDGIGAWCEGNFAELTIHKDIRVSPNYLAEKYEGGWPFAENIFRVWIKDPREEQGQFLGFCQDVHGLSRLVGIQTPDRLTFTKTYEDEAVAGDPSLNPKIYNGVLGQRYQWPMIGEFRDVAGLITIEGELQAIPFIMTLSPHYRVRGNPRARYW